MSNTLPPPIFNPLETKTIDIVVNGEPRQAPPDLSLDQLLAFLAIDPARVAVERNRDLVRKPDWNRTTICSGDELEIVQFVGGG